MSKEGTDRAPLPHLAHFSTVVYMSLCLHVYDDNGSVGVHSFLSFFSPVFNYVKHFVVDNRMNSAL